MIRYKIKLFLIRYYTLLGKNKHLPKGYELPVLRALSHYPELRDVAIDFVFTISELEFQSRPEPLSVLFPWKPRVYQVLISTEVPKNLAAGRIDQLPLQCSNWCIWT